MPDHPFKTPVTEDQFYVHDAARLDPLPNFAMPPLMNNHGNYIVSLGNVCRWLGAKAEALGVEIYPGFAATEVLYDESGAVIGVATGDMGVEKDGTPGPAFQRGMALLGKYVLIGEGVRGSLAKQLIARFDLAARPRAAEIRHRHQGTVAGQAGEPQAGPGAAFLRLAARHARPAAARSSTTSRTIWSRSASSCTSTTRTRTSRPSRSSSASRRIQAIREIFEGGKRLSYGARAITEGGWQSVPKLSFPGGALIGCSAGFVNVPRIKGSHNAMLSGMLAAEKAACRARRRGAAGRAVRVRSRMARQPTSART